MYRKAALCAVITGVIVYKLLVNPSLITPHAPVTEAVSNLRASHAPLSASCRMDLHAADYFATTLNYPMWNY